MYSDLNNQMSSTGQYLQMIWADFSLLVAGLFELETFGSSFRVYGPFPGLLLCLQPWKGDDDEDDDGGGSDDDDEVISVY